MIVPAGVIDSEPLRYQSLPPPRLVGIAAHQRQRARQGRRLADAEVVDLAGRDAAAAVVMGARVAFEVVAMDLATIERLANRPRSPDR